MSKLPKWLFWLEDFVPSVHAQPSLQNIELPNVEHGALPTESMDAVFAILGLEPPSGVTSYIEPDAILSYWFASPVEVKIIDPDGNILTKDINEIPGAGYEGTNDPAGPKIVIIPNPKDGEYRVELTGISGGGQYAMGTIFTSDGGTDMKTAGHTLSDTEQIGYSIQVDTTAEGETVTEFGETYIPEEDGGEEEDKTAMELLEGLIAELKGRPVLQVHVKLAKGFLERAQELAKKEHGFLLDRRVALWEDLGESQMEEFIKTVELYQKKGWLDAATAEGLVQKAQEIIAKI